ncbi:hypothetical protein IE53DRAFT_367243 [Violaceomyces palustris]|uniref:Uncharacterized protein n=1 Tax=Violaceomyces palustris TaxID=1673888 RepID=A0ACD0P346_9BASI|nr:hypothetical protein IE53DRAFT_367243 [Violaceomyces palustris]
MLPPQHAGTSSTSIPASVSSSTSGRKHPQNALPTPSTSQRNHYQDQRNHQYPSSPFLRAGSEFSLSSIPPPPMSDRISSMQPPPLPFPLPPSPLPPLAHRSTFAIPSSPSPHPTSSHSRHPLHHQPQQSQLQSTTPAPPFPLSSFAKSPRTPIRQPSFNPANQPGYPLHSSSLAFTDSSKTFPSYLPFHIEPPPPNRSRHLPRAQSVQPRSKRASSLRAPSVVGDGRPRSKITKSDIDFLFSAMAKEKQRMQVQKDAAPLAPTPAPIPTRNPPEPQATLPAPPGISLTSDADHQARRLSKSGETEALRPSAMAMVATDHPASIQAPKSAPPPPAVTNVPPPSSILPPPVELHRWFLNIAPVKAIPKRVLEALPTKTKAQRTLKQEARSLRYWIFVEGFKKMTPEDELGEEAMEEEQQWHTSLIVKVMDTSVDARRALLATTASGKTYRLVGDQDIAKTRLKVEDSLEKRRLASGDREELGDDFDWPNVDAIAEGAFEGDWIPRIMAALLSWEKMVFESHTSKRRKNDLALPASSTESPVDDGARSQEDLGLSRGLDLISPPVEESDAGGKRKEAPAVVQSTKKDNPKSTSEAQGPSSLKKVRLESPPHISSERPSRSAKEKADKQISIAYGRYHQDSQPRSPDEEETIDDILLPESDHGVEQDIGVGFTGDATELQEDAPVGTGNKPSDRVGGLGKAAGNSEPAGEQPPPRNEGGKGSGTELEHLSQHSTSEKKGSSSKEKATAVIIIPGRLSGHQGIPDSPRAVNLANPVSTTTRKGQGQSAASEKITKRETPAISTPKKAGSFSIKSPAATMTPTSGTSKPTPPNRKLPKEVRHLVSSPFGALNAVVEGYYSGITDSPTRAVAGEREREDAAEVRQTRSSRTTPRSVGNGSTPAAGSSGPLAGATASSPFGGGGSGLETTPTRPSGRAPRAARASNGVKPWWMVNPPAFTPAMNSARHRRSYKRSTSVQGPKAVNVPEVTSPGEGGTRVVKTNGKGKAAAKAAVVIPSEEIDSDDEFEPSSDQDISSSFSSSPSSPATSSSSPRSSASPKSKRVNVRAAEKLGRSPDRQRGGASAKQGGGGDVDSDGETSKERHQEALRLELEALESEEWLHEEQSRLGVPRKRILERMATVAGAGADRPLESSEREKDRVKWVGSTEGVVEGEGGWWRKGKEAGGGVKTQASRGGGEQRGDRDKGDADRDGERDKGEEEESSSEDFEGNFAGKPFNLAALGADQDEYEFSD